MISRYYIAKNLQDVDALIQACKSTGYCSFDYETNAEPLYTDRFTPTLLSITFQPGSSVCIPLDHFERDKYTDGFSWKEAIKRIGRQVFQNSNITKMAWNLKFDDQINRLYGVSCKGTCIDGMLAKYILDEEKPNGLKDMVRRYLPEFADYEKENNIDKLPWDKKPLEPLCKYGGLDTDCTFRLCIFLEAKLIQKGMYNILRNLYMPASKLLTEVEANGLYLDREFNQKLLSEYKPKIEAAKQTIYDLPRVKKFQQKYNQQRIEAYLEKIQNEIDKMDPDDPKDKRKIDNREKKIANVRAGIFSNKAERSLIAQINLNSPNDLPALMYSKDGLKLPIIAYTQKDYKDTDQPSTAEDTLVELRLTIKDPNNPKAIFLDKLLELRGLEKMYKTYILGWSEKVQDDDCLHGRFLLHGTTSGRLSSQEPNMQQIPKTSVDPNIKKQLIARPGQLYLVMDFSQAELRIMAHLSGDETYLKAFREGQDPHLAIAAKKYGIPYEQALAIHDDENHPDHKLWKTRRKQAKQIAFGLIYGIQAKLLSVKLSDPKSGLIVSPDEAQQMMDEFFEEHPKIKTFMVKQEKLLKKQGYIKSLFGTKRRLPGIYSENNKDVAYAIRLAVNFPCQCAASHMTLFGSILNYWNMKQGYFPPMMEVCTVHDAAYYNTVPEYINVYTIWKMWDTFRNPQTKKYFGFQIDDVDLSMDFEIGRDMGEELPFIPGYDYHKMLEPNFSVEEYMEEHKKFKDIEIKKYPEVFPELLEIGKNWRKL